MLAGSILPLPMIGVYTPLIIGTIFIMGSFSFICLYLILRNNINIFNKMFYVILVIAIIFILVGLIHNIVTGKKNIILYFLIGISYSVAFATIYRSFHYVFIFINIRKSIIRKLVIQMKYPPDIYFLFSYMIQIQKQ